MDNDKHFPWLVRARFDNQWMVLWLYNLSKESSGRPENERNALAWLTGAAFSLWRAAPLVGSERTQVLTDGDNLTLLSVLIQDNAVPFSKEFATRHWMGAYYVSNALWRLKGVSKLLGDEESKQTDIQEHMDLRGNNFNALSEWDFANSVLRRLLNGLDPDGHAHPQLDDVSPHHEALPSS